MRAFNAFTSSGISAVICSAVVTDLSPLLLFGEGKGDSVLNPFGVPLPREPRKLYVLLGEVFDLALTDKPGHLLPERRSPHHPVPPRGQDVETLHRLVDDGEVIRRVIDRGRPRARYRQGPERRVCRLPVRTQSLVVVPVEVDLVASRLVSLIDRVAHAKQNTLLLGPPVVALAHVEHQRERMLSPLRHVREADDLVPHGHHGNLHPDHAANIPRPPRTSSVHYPLRLESAAHTLDHVPSTPLLDAPHLAHLQQVNRIIEEHRTGGIAGRHRRMDVPVVRRVRGPHKAVPVQVRKASPALLRLHPLVLDPRRPPHLDQPQETFLLLLRLSDDVVPRLTKTGVETQLFSDPQIQLPGEPAQLRSRLRTALLTDHAGRAARRPAPGPAPLQHRDPPETTARQPVRRPQPKVSTANHNDVVDRHAQLLLTILRPPPGSPIHGCQAARTSLLNRDSVKRCRDELAVAAARMRHFPLPDPAELTRQLLSRRTGDHDPIRMYS